MTTKLVPGLPGEVNMRGQWSDSLLSVFFAFLAVAAGIGVALTVRQFGAVSLLLLPAVGLFVISVLYPELGLMALIIVTYTQTSNVLIKFHGLPSIAQPLAALMIVVILIRLFAFGDHAEGWTSAAIRFLAYGFVIFLSVLAAKTFQPAYVDFQDYVKDALVALIAVVMIQNPARFKRAIWAIIFAGILIGTISAFQSLTHTFDNTYFGYGGWVAEVAGGSSNNRASGPFTNPNAFAQVLVVVAVLALDRLWHERNIALRIFAGWAIIASVLGIFFSYSRGGLLALIFAMAVLFIERRPNFLPLLLTALIGMALLQYLPATYTDRVSTLRELFAFDNTQLTTQSYRGRLSENIASWLMFRDNPVLGVGPQNFSIQYQQYSRQLGLDPRSTARSPASLYGEIIAEQGMLGLIVFGGLIISVHFSLRQGKRLFLESHLKDHANMTTALWAGLAGYLFAAITKNSAYSNIFWLLIGVAMASFNVAAYSYRTHQSLAEKESLQAR